MQAMGQPWQLEPGAPHGHFVVQTWLATRWAGFLHFPIAEGLLHVLQSVWNGLWPGLLA